MNIIGCDPGTIKTGITHITGTTKKPQFKTELIGYDCDPSVLPKFEERLVYIVDKITKLIDAANPELVIIEYPFGISGNARKLIELFGIIRYHCILKKYNFIALESTRIKKYATGKGRCEKSDMRLQAYKELKIDAGEDVADSVWIGHFGMGFLYPETLKLQFRIDSMERMKAPKKKKAKKKEVLAED